MTTLHITWGRFRKISKAKFGLNKGRWIAYANSAIYLNNVVIQEQMPALSSVLRSDGAEHEGDIRTPPSGEPIPADVETADEFRLHEDTYEVAAGTRVVLWVDRGDAHGRFANYPAWITCEVLDEPLTADNTLADAHCKVGPVKVVRIEHRESAFFMEKEPNAVAQALEKVFASTDHEHPHKHLNLGGIDLGVRQ